jgi:hypothetical protein
VDLLKIFSHSAGMQGDRDRINFVELIFVRSSGRGEDVRRIRRVR